MLHTEERPDGSLLLRNQLALAAYPANIVEWLHQHAARTPDRPFLLGRNEVGAWAGVTYGEAQQAVNRLSEGLLAEGLASERPLALLSPNSVDMALLQLAAMQLGTPVTPISYAYSVRSADAALVKHILDATGAAALFLDEPDLHLPKLAGWTGYTVALSEAPQRGEGSLSAEGRARFAAVGHDTLAKVQFTSGSTSLPKGVKVTHGMMASNVVGIGQTWPFLASDEVLLDWLPWNHTFGGNLITNLALMLGATFHIDGGSPTPEGMARTVENIIDVRPTMYFGVPRSYTQLLTDMRRSERLKRAFFERLKFMFVAAAALDPTTYDALRAIGRQVRGEEVPFFSAWGCTETAPNATHVYWPGATIGNIGVPAPGVTIKLAPDASGKRELRVKGPNVTAGYINGEAAFDDEGFYCTGDAGTLADLSDPAKGLLFNGRLGEDFKLTSGVWVHNAALRRSITALGQPYVFDVVIAAPNRPYLGALIFPDLPALREEFQALAAAHPDDAVFTQCEEIAALFAGILARHNAAESGSSKRIRRYILLPRPPRFDEGETTDKGYVNQAAVLENYDHLVEALYTEPLAPPVFSVDAYASP